MRSNRLKASNSPTPFRRAMTASMRWSVIPLAPSRYTTSERAIPSRATRLPRPSRPRYMTSASHSAECSIGRVVGRWMGGALQGLGEVLVRPANYTWRESTLSMKLRAPVRSSQGISVGARHHVRRTLGRRILPRSHAFARHAAPEHALSHDLLRRLFRVAQRWQVASLA